MGMSNQTEEKELFHAVSLSGGKDSTAMLLLMIERGLPIQAVLTADTGMEFPEMYEHLQKLNDYLFAERGLHLTWLRHPKGFEWLMFEEKKQRPASIENRQRLGVSLYGNGWPGPRVRWCTGQLKTHLIHKEINRLKGQYRAVSYVGIAADEPKRIKSERYPLVDWGITEKEALQICYDRGYDFGGLYQIYHRCSCWCCPLQGIGELRKLRQYPKPAEGIAPMVLNDVTYAERENAGKAIIEACTHMNGAETVSIGSYRGFSMLLSYDGAANEFRMVLKGKLSHTAVLGADAGGNVTRIDNALEKITEHLANARSQLAHTTEQLENARTEMTAPFPKEAELAEKTRRLNELNVLLNLNEQDRPVMADEPDEGDRIRPKNAERER